MPKFCPSCGEEISDKVKFCPKCGADIDSFSVKKDEKSIVEETKKEIKIEDTKVEDKKSEKKYSLSQMVVYGVIGVVIIILLMAAISMFTAFSSGMNENIHPSPKVTSSPTIVTTTQMVVTTTPTTIAPTPVRTSVQVKDANQQWGSSSNDNLITLIPVVPAISSGNEPSVVEKAKYSTVSYAQSFAYDQAKQHGMTQTPVQTTRPLIHTFTDQDSKLELTNRDTLPHVYYVEVNFYNGATKLITNTGQWKNNGYSWYVEPGQTIRAEVIPPENATSYVINYVAIAATGMYSTGYDLIQT